MTGLFPSAREGALGSGSVNESQLPDRNAVGLNRYEHLTLLIILRDYCLREFCATLLNAVEHG